MNPTSNTSGPNIPLNQVISSAEVQNPILPVVPSPPPEFINVVNVHVDMATNSHQRDRKEGDNEEVTSALSAYKPSKSNSNETSTSSSNIQTSQSPTSIDSIHKYTSTEIKIVLKEFMGGRNELKEIESTRNRESSNGVSEPALSTPLRTGLAATVHTLTESSTTGSANAMHTLEGTSRAESASASHSNDSKESLSKNKDVRPKVLTSKGKIKKNILVSINDLFHRKKDVEIEEEEIEEKRHVHVSNVSKLLASLLVLDNPFETEGIFRKSAVKEDLDLASKDMQQFIENKQNLVDSILIADLIKRELESSISYKEREKMLNLSLENIETLLGKNNDWKFLPLPIFSMLQICTFVLEKQKMNKMTSESLARIFYPRIFPLFVPSKPENDNLGKNIENQTKWLELMIEKWIDLNEKSVKEADGAEAPSL